MATRLWAYLHNVLSIKEAELCEFFLGESSTLHYSRATYFTLVTPKIHYIRIVVVVIDASERLADLAGCNGIIRRVILPE